MTTEVEAGRALDLTQILSDEPGRVFTKSELVRDCGFRNDRELDRIASRIRRARVALGQRPAPVNVWGIGYRWAE